MHENDIINKEQNVGSMRRLKRLKYQKKTRIIHLHNIINTVYVYSYVHVSLITT